VKKVSKASSARIDRVSAALRRLPLRGAGRHLHGLAAVVDQEELQLHRADRGQAAGLVALHHGVQRVAGVALIGLAVLAEHPDRQQRGRRLKPGHRHEAAFGGFQHAIGIALFEDQRAVVDILAPDVEVQDREGEAGSVLHHLVGKTRRHALAARLPVQVGGGHANGPHVGVLSQPVFHRHVNSGKARIPAPGASKGGPPDAQDRTMPLVLPLVSIAFPAACGGSARVRAGARII
jgi:hypothetical protein